MSQPPPPAHTGSTRDELATLCQSVLPVWSRHLLEARSQSETAVREMLAAFNQIEQGLGRLHAACDGASTAKAEGAALLDGLQAQVERMYRSFQYEDRISQMLALLRQDMERLLDAVGSATLPEPAQWLARLHSEYAMAEQRTLHHADAHPEGSDGRSPGGSDAVDFF